jgi:hypothetical protein
MDKTDIRAPAERPLKGWSQALRARPRAF